MPVIIVEMWQGRTLKQKKTTGRGDNGGICKNRSSRGAGTDYI